MQVELSLPQTDIFTDRSRFKVIVAGRRFGKTFLALTFLLSHALQRNDAGVCYYVAPTYRMAKRIAWRMLIRMVPPGRIADINQTDLSVTLNNDVEISLRGADNPDSLRGVDLFALVLDEYALMDPDTWLTVLRPTLSISQGPAMFIGTPDGFNHFYKLFNDANAMTDGSWSAWQYTTEAGGLVSKEEIEAARRDMPEKKFNQEYRASFEALVGRVYYAFNRRLHVAPDLKENPLAPIRVGMDFNVAPGMHATIFQMLGGQIHFLDEIFIPDGNTEEMAQEIVRRYGIKQTAFGPVKREIICYPDPTGNSRKTSAPVGQTDFTILRGFGIRVLAPNRSYSLADKHNTVNAALKSADGRVRVYVHPRCKGLISSWEGLTYKADASKPGQGTGIPDKSSGLDHMADAGAYPICYEMPITQRVTLMQEI